MEIFTGEMPFIELTREDMLKVKWSRSILPIIYGYIMPMIKEKWGIEKGTEKLKEFGKRLMQDLLEYWTPKGKNIPEVLKDTYKFLFLVKLYKIKEFKKETPRRWIVYDKNCPLCWEGVEETEIHYCIAIAGGAEEMINVLHERGYKEIPRVNIHTLTSKARGDKMCSHEITEII